MLVNLSLKNSLVNRFVSEMRDVQQQADRMRFRRNMERLGEICAYEISKELTYRAQAITTPLGIAHMHLPADEPVVATILRAGLPLHQGILNYFDRADNAFISAYRYHHRDHSFEVKVEYASCPPLEGRTLILADPMVATGTSLVLSYKALLQYGQPAQIFVVTAIGSEAGIAHVKKHIPGVKIYAAAVDAELTAKAYIVPGLGDAGDLAFGEKK